MAFIEGWSHLRGVLYEGFHCILRDSPRPWLTHISIAVEHKKKAKRRKNWYRSNFGIK